LGSTFDGQVLTDSLFMRVTDNNFTSGTPSQNADFVYFISTPIIGSARAYELQDAPPLHSNTEAVELIGYIDSLHLSAFVQVSGGFVDPGIDLAPTPSIPEPTMAVMLALGLFALGFARRRTKGAG
jgi:hypothetical protein